MPPRISRLLAALVACAGALAVASSAMAAGPPAISGANGQYWNIASPTPSYTITGDAPDAVIDWAASNGAAGQLIGGGPVTLPGFPNGPGSLTATQTIPLDPDPGTATRTFTVDTVAPTITGSATDTPATPGVPTPEGWYRTSVLVSFTCGGHTSCSGSTTLSSSGAGQAVTGAAGDDAGNSAQYTVSGINIDKVAPQAASPQTPAAGASIATLSPTFTWGFAGDTPSGLLRYELIIGGLELARTLPGGPPRTATVSLSPGGHTWFIRTRDRAGNVTNGPSRTFTIDPSTPKAPTITGGPPAITNAVAPTFSWTGTGPKYRWTLVKDGVAAPVQKSASDGPATSAALAPLSQGTYTFTVVQINAAGTVSEGASRTFIVDTTAPGALTITGRPPSPTTSPTPAFSWTGAEPASVATWQVLNSGGAVVQGPANSLGSSVAVGPLGPGAYAFQLRQTDAAGNAGPLVSEGFTIVPGAAPATATGGRARLPTRNAKRLRPRAGLRLPTTKPVLSWVRGPRGTTSYNVQVFRVANPNAKTSNALRLLKVRSLFPRSTQIRVNNLKRGQCYVWRVWPFRGTTFTKQPLGLSHFCIAKKGPGAAKP